MQDENHPIVELEMKEVIQSLHETKLLSWRNFFDIRELLNTRARRYRTALNFSFSWFGQFCKFIHLKRFHSLTDASTAGNNVISYYLPLMVDKVGITDPNTQILLNGIYALTGWIAATAGAFCHDRLGRRTMFMLSTSGMAVCLAIVAGGSAGYVNSGSVPASKAGIAFIFGKNSYMI